MESTMRTADTDRISKGLRLSVTLKVSGSRRGPRSSATWTFEPRSPANRSSSVDMSIPATDVSLSITRRSPATIPAFSEPQSDREQLAALERAAPLPFGPRHVVAVRVQGTQDSANRRRDQLRVAERIGVVQTNVIEDAGKSLKLLVRGAGLRGQRARRRREKDDHDAGDHAGRPTADSRYAAWPA